IVSRNVALRVAIVDGDTGADLGSLNVSGVAGGTFALSMITVAEDGAIYGANLSGGTTAPPSFKVYRWATESSAPVVIFNGNPGGTLNGRWGDNIDSRGEG